MFEMKKESEFAKKELDCKPYRSRISDLQNQLHNLREELAEVEKSVLQNQGYKPINIDNYTIMVPVGMTLNQLQVSMQQMPPPDEKQTRAIKHLVDEEDKGKIRESEEYNTVVEKRKEVIDSIMTVYNEFWEEEVYPVSESDEQKIVYMLAGLDKNIRSRKLSSITDIPREKCKMYSLKEGIVYRKD